MRTSSWTSRTTGVQLQHRSLSMPPGAAASEVIVLLTPEDIDVAAKLSVDYRPPGS